MPVSARPHPSEIRHGTDRVELVLLICFELAADAGHIMGVLLDFDSSARSEESVATMRVKLEANGRVLLPVEIRRQLGVSPGDTV